MRARPLCSSVFMNVSESRIERVRWSGSEDEKWYVTRLFDKPDSYNRWESFHFDLVKKVAAIPTQKGQIFGLRKARFSLLQHQALFEYLRESGLKGRNREIVVAAFHSSTEFSRALRAEHGRYLRSNSSLLCVDYLGSALMNDERFNAELERYRKGYMEFFSLYCDWVIAEEYGHEFPLQPMIGFMKDDLSEMRARMMSIPVANDRRQARRSAWI